MGTALAAVAAIGGLWAQAVASYWGQETAKDQLSQSKDDSEREKRDQASRVTYWFEERLDIREETKLHVMNRSPDPVSNITVRVTYPPHDPGAREEYVKLESLAPCSEYHYTLAPGPGQEELSPGGAPAWVNGYPEGATYVTFTDSNGRSWKRTPARLHEYRESDLDKIIVSEFYSSGKPDEVTETDTCAGEKK
ncbi:hypothetical protein OHA98_36725 [Streptomyces sp. NBC_00654]|uniref:hypothetical protein n=1 Tax=Streptomyces sp. NBC_00654 TaxID=2975799 RepID=UPI0022501D64|nr:hypothetical protein [Streptomyces sp. NBC_00654]MCX4970208.1 hypothetical protein [Streptomyces sp. NBC_00654]